MLDDFGASVKNGKMPVLAHFCPSLNSTQIPTNSHFFQSVKNHHNPFTPTPAQPPLFHLPNLFSVETNRKNCHFFLSKFSFYRIPFPALHLFAKNCNFFLSFSHPKYFLTYNHFLSNPPQQP